MDLIPGPNISAAHNIVRRFFMNLPDKGLMISSPEGTSFLALAWNEMFDPYTPDTFQPRILNVPSLVRELGMFAAKAEKAPRWQAHVQAIQLELAAALDSEDSLLDQMPFYKWSCLSLCKEQNSARIATLAKTLEGNAGRYEEVSVRVFQASLAQLPKNKESNLKSLYRLGTIALTKGFRQDDFSDLFAEAAFKKQPSEWAYLLISQLQTANQEPGITFRCTLAVHAELIVLQVLARTAGFQLEKATNVAQELRDATPNAHYLTIEVHAPTGSEAIRLAVRRLRPALDIFNFYDRSHAFTIVDDAWISSDTFGARLAKAGGQSLRKLSRRKNADDLAQRALKKIPPTLLTGRILNALEHYTLAQTNSAYRVKLVNLWSAVECLSNGSNAESVIGRVCDTVTPIVLWRRVDKITRYIATVLTVWVKQGFTENLGPGFTIGKVVSAEEVLLALSKPEKHADILALLAATKDHPLLCNRIFTLWKHFSDPKALLRELELSKTRTNWHLWRIYRARNLIVHDGEETTFVPHLVDNLQYYFSLTLSRLLHSMSFDNGWTMEDSVAHWKSRCDYVLHSLENRPSALRVRDFFPLPNRKLNEALW